MSAEQPRRGPAHRSPFILVWIILLAIAVIAAGVFVTLWIAQPKPNELSFELAKTCLQIIGLTVIGGVLTVATSAVQHARQEDAKLLEHQREKGFQIRSSLLDRSTRCAQEMFITCNHVQRLKTDVQRLKTDADLDNPKGLTASELLDSTYLKFSTEAVAIEVELGARFGEGWIQGDGRGEAFLRWHQIEDLLTVYYYALSKPFPAALLARTSVGYESKMHSGVDFTLMVLSPAHPSPEEVKRVIQGTKAAFWEAIPKFAEAVLRDAIRDL